MHGVNKHWFPTYGSDADASRGLKTKRQMEKNRRAMVFQTANLEHWNLSFITTDSSQSSTSALAGDS